MFYEVRRGYLASGIIIHAVESTHGYLGLLAVCTVSLPTLQSLGVASCRHRYN